MAKLKIALKNGGGSMEIETSHEAAMRIFNRYMVFLRQGAQGSHKFNLDGADEGVLALSYENVAAVQVSAD